MAGRRPAALLIAALLAQPALAQSIGRGVINKRTAIRHGSISGGGIGGTPSGGVVIPDPVAYYAFDDADYSGSTHLEPYNDYDATEHSGSITSVTGKVNEARSFTGVGFPGPHYDIAEDNAFDVETTDPFSFAVWVKTPTVGRRLFTKWDFNTISGWDSYVAADGHIAVQLRNGPASAKYHAESVTDGYADDAWHHIVITYDGSEDASGFSFYIDGADVGGTTVTNTDPGSTLNAIGPMISGMRSGGVHGNSPWDGELDELAFWDVELTSAQAIEVHALGVAGTRIDER